MKDRAIRGRKTAELDVKTAEASGQEELMEEPRARLARVEDQLKALDKLEAKID